MKTPKEILQEEIEGIGLFNYMHAIRTIQLKQWSWTSLEQTIYGAMRKYAEQQNFGECEKLKREITIANNEVERLNGLLGNTPPPEEDIKYLETTIAGRNILTKIKLILANRFNTHPEKIETEIILAIINAQKKCVG